MYEIWLALNIAWEIAAGLWPLLLGAALLWSALMLTAWRRPGSRWRAGLPLALGTGMAAAGMAVALLPGWTGSSLSQLTYGVDWAILLALSAGFGAVALAFVWPLSAMRHGPTRT